MATAVAMTVDIDNAKEMGYDKWDVKNGYNGWNMAGIL
jgi:hypothetical protein